MISIKDFARQQGCGESIVYRHIRNHREELGDRVQKLHGRTWLTPEGEQYIRNLMTQHMVIEEKAAPEVKSLQKQIDEQKVTIEAQKNIIEMLKLKMEQYEEEKLRLESSTARLEVEKADLSAENARIDKEARESQETAQKVIDELSRAYDEEKKRHEDEEHLLRQRAEAAEKKNQELENRTFGDYLKGLFRRKDKVKNGVNDQKAD